MNRLCAPTALLLLVACSGEDEVSLTNVSAKDVAEAMRDRIKMEPGLWQIDTEVVEIEIPGVPPEVRKQIKGVMDGVQQAEHCLTEAEARRPPAEMFAGQGNNQCRYERFTMDSGRIDGTVRCSSPDGSQATIRMAGAYTPTAYTVDIRIAGQHFGQSMTVQTRGRGTRAGACPGS